MIITLFCSAMERPVPHSRKKPRPFLYIYILYNVIYI